MEQAEQAEMTIGRSVRAYEKYGWIILLASALLGIFLAVLTAIPPENIRSSPLMQLAYPIMTTLSISTIGFFIFAMVTIVFPYRRGERWAWFTLWMLPLLWLAQFVLSPDLMYYLVLAIMSVAGLVLPYRRFFSGSQEESSRVS